MEVIDKSIMHTIAQAVNEAFSQFDSDNITIDTAKNPKTADFQCAHSLKIAKKLGKSPREIAEAASVVLQKNPIFSFVEVAGPGFINMKISDELISSWVNDCSESKDLLASGKNNEKVIVEFSSPNIAKAMHVGHLRSTIIGESIARLLEFLGYDVLRLNHVGDFGTQFGMLITYMKKYKPYAMDDDHSSLDDLVVWYKAAKKLFDEDEDFKEQARKEVVHLQSGEEEAVRFWTKMCEISRRGFSEIYARLGVTIQERGESFYNPLLQGVIDDFKEKGIAKIDNGALCVFMDEFKNKDGSTLPLIIQKKDGGFNYAATDLATFKYRIQTDKAKRIIVVTDLGQKLHFTMAAKAAKMIGYLDEDVQFDHVPFGLVLSPDGTKYKTRSGKTEKLSDLLDEAVKRAKKILEDRNIENPDEIARVLGLSAVKYADLSSNRIKDYTFSYDRMLQFEGNTAAFILYAYVRIASIKRKCGIDIESIQNEKIAITEPSERVVMLHLAKFASVLELIKDDLLLHHLTEYLHVLAEKFNAFFRDCPVQNSEHTNSRLLLIDLVARHIEKGLYILGIETIDRM